MRIAGLVLLAAGWLIAISSIAMLPTNTLRMIFVLAALAVEAIGLALLVRRQRTLAEELD
jgi:hypothetical protein